MRLLLRVVVVAGVAKVRHLRWLLLLVAPTRCRAGTSSAVLDSGRQDGLMIVDSRQTCRDKKGNCRRPAAQHHPSAPFVRSSSLDEEEEVIGEAAQHCC